MVSLNGSLGTERFRLDKGMMDWRGSMITRDLDWKAERFWKKSRKEIGVKPLFSYERRIKVLSKPEEDSVALSAKPIWIK
jgi:hypothetical protein